MIETGPGRTFRPVLEAAPAGLADTLGVRLLDGDTELIARTTGANETPDGSGIYTGPELTAPTTGGVYLLVWDWPDGATTSYASEELVVDRTAPAVYPVPAVGYVTRGQVEAEVPALPAGAPGDRIIARAERAIDALLGPYPRDPTSGLKWDLTRVYDWQAAAVQAAVVAQVEYLVTVGPDTFVTPSATVVKGPDFELTYDSAAAARPAVGPRVALELAPIADLIRITGARARA